MANKPRLSEHAERLLASLPVPERDWEAQARAVEAQLPTVAPGSTESMWLAEPLPATSEERRAVAGTADTPFPFEAMGTILEAPPSEPDATRAAPAAAGPLPSVAAASPLGSGASPSLSALARSVVQKANRTQASRDLAKASLSVASAARAHSDGQRIRPARPVPPSQGAARAERPFAPAPKPQQRLGLFLSVGGLGLAAAVALWGLGRPRAGSPPHAAGPATPPALQQRAPIQTAPVAEGAPKVTRASSAPASTEPSVPPALAASALALAPRTATGAASMRAHSELAAAPSAAPHAAAARPGIAASARPSPESILLDDTPTSAKAAGSKRNATPPANEMRPASNSSGLPDRPSTGAVQAAVGSVMGAARACVVGGSATPAQVTFGSDGTVQAVAVSGPNAGSATASCIEGALRRARVAPFANPNFSLMVWVRP